MFGGAELVAGAVVGSNKGSTNQVTFDATFTDGKKILATADLSTYQRINAKIIQAGFETQGLINLDEGLPPPEPKKGGFLFWLAVAIIPMISAWFTLQKKYTTTERVVAFGWLALTIAFTIAGKK